MFSQCNQCFTAAKAENKTNQTQMTMQSDTRLFGWRQDLLKLVQKGAGDCSISWHGEGLGSLPSFGTEAIIPVRNDDTYSLQRPWGTGQSVSSPFTQNRSFFQEHSLQFNKTPNQNSKNRIFEVGPPQIWIHGFAPFPQIPKGGGWNQKIGPDPDLAARAHLSNTAVRYSQILTE